jgi:hypothetical protein
VTPLETLRADLREDAEELAEHLTEIETGYRLGDAAHALPEEPRPEFDPAETTLQQRVVAKGKELDRGRTWIWDKLKRFRDARGDPGALVPRSAVRSTSRGERFEPEALDAIVEKLVRHAAKKTKIRDARLYAQLCAEIDRHNADPANAEEQIDAPPERTFHRKLPFYKRAIGQTKNATKKTVIGRVDAPDRTPKSARISATRPGECVVIDTSPLDLLLVDDETEEEVRYRLILAIDVFSRSVVAFSLVPGDPSASDVALLIHDIVFPAWSAGKSVVPSVPDPLEVAIS